MLITLPVNKFCFDLFQSYIGILENISNVNYVAIGISVTCLLLLLVHDFIIKPMVNKKCTFPIPIQVQ